MIICSSSVLNSDSELVMTDDDFRPRPLPDEDGQGPAASPTPWPDSDPSAELHPWDEAPPPGDPDDPDDPDARSSAPSARDGPRQRHDAFTEAKKGAFLKALAKTGCILDACRLTGAAQRTVYRHQESDPRFLDHCAAALRMSATPIELTAWQRAVEGVEQEYCVAGEVRVRRRYDSSLLRLLLQGSNPKKYGPRPGFKRKRLLRHERREMEREIRAEIEAKRKLNDRSEEQLAESIHRKLDVLERRNARVRSAAGWTKSPDGHWIPPGYAPIPGWVAPPAASEEEEPPLDSL